MFKISKSIFSKNVVFNCNDEYIDSLIKSTKLYPDVKTEHIDVRIFIVDDFKVEDSQVVATNPTVFKLTRDGYYHQFRGLKIKYSYDGDILDITFSLTKAAKWKSAINTLRSVEYSSKTDVLVQVLHEMILVPLTFHFDDILPIHASSVYHKDECVLFAGTGGVGKSTALLSLSGDESVSFCSDDIAIISKDGLAYSNFAWPKIYGYNCLGNDFKTKLLQGRSIFDKLLFNIKMNLNPSKVRRKISPDTLYAGGVKQNAPIKKMYYLFKEDVPSITTSNISKEVAFEITKSIMKTEYADFIKYLEWHSYNLTLIEGYEVSLLDKVYSNWKASFFKAFENVEIIKLSIPINISHEDYQAFIENMEL